MRAFFSAFLGVLITCGLVGVMTFLISQDFELPEEGERTKISDIRMPDREIETRYDNEKPDKPDEVQEQPDIPQADLDPPDISAEAVNISAPQVETNFDVSGGTFVSDGDYLPITRVEPTYPTRAASRGIEGYVIVEFTVTETGAVINPVVVEAEPSSIFNRAAERAVSKWKYKPRVIDGTPVQVPNVRTQLTFKLDQ